LLLEKLRAFCEEFPGVRTVSVKALRGKVWEIRVRDGRGREHRLLCAVAGGDLVVLHAFVKKSQKTPPGDLALAERRLKEMTR
jgi:phage-related protein